MNISNRIKIKWKWVNLLCLAAPLLSFIFIKPDAATQLAAKESR